MLQSRNGLGFPVKPGAGFTMAGKMWVEELERHLPLQICIKRPIDRRHTATTDLFEDLVASDFPTDGVLFSH